MSHAKTLLSLITTVLLLAACSKEAPPPPPAPLQRPLHTVQVENGKISIPRKLITERHGVPGVFVLQDGKTARFRMLSTGKIRNERVEVLSGLHASDSLVAGDLTFVMDGSPIEPLASEPASGKR